MKLLKHILVFCLLSMLLYIPGMAQVVIHQVEDIQKVPKKYYDKEESLDEPDAPLRYAEIMPEFPGGLDSLYSFLQKELDYPKIAIDNGIQGTVLVEFVVERNGRISHAKVLVSLFPDCDVEALRCVMSMPKWKPGYNIGKPVRCYFDLPVRFKLPN